MKEEKIKTQIEIFVCNHHRDDNDNCAAMGGKELTDKLKKWAKENYPKEIKVYRSGCLSKCSDGIAIACYPEKKIIIKAKPDDSKEIKKGLEEALEKIKNS